MRKSRTPGSVRGVSGNGYPYRDIVNYEGRSSFTVVLNLRPFRIY